MKIRLSVAFILGVGSLVATMPVFAHHSFAAQYDWAKPTTLNGTVKRVDWINPHARFFVEVTTSGKPVLWEIELAAPAGLMR